MTITPLLPPPALEAPPPTAVVRSRSRLTPTAARRVRSTTATQTGCDPCWERVRQRNATCILCCRAAPRPRRYRRLLSSSFVVVVVVVCCRGRRLLLSWSSFVVVVVVVCCRGRRRLLLLSSSFVVVVVVVCCRGRRRLLLSSSSFVVVVVVVVFGCRRAAAAVLPFSSSSSLHVASTPRPRCVSSGRRRRSASVTAVTAAPAGGGDPDEQICQDDSRRGHLINKIYNYNLQKSFTVIQMDVA